MLPIVSDCSYLAPRQKLDFTPQNQQLHYEASKTSSGDIGSSASYSNHPFEGVFQIEDRVWRPLYSEQQTDSIRRFWILIGQWLKITSWIDHIWRKFWKGLGLFSAWEKTENLVTQYYPQRNLERFHLNFYIQFLFIFNL